MWPVFRRVESTQPARQFSHRLTEIRIALANGDLAAARAMANFGLTDLRIVNPRDGWPNPKAVAMASGAGRLLDEARIAARMPSPGLGRRRPKAYFLIELRMFWAWAVRSVPAANRTGQLPVPAK